MEAILYVLKTVGRPASVIFFLIVIGIGIVLSIVRGNRPVSRWYFGVVFLSYWVFSTPACAERLIQWSGRGFHPLLGAGDARGARVVVVLGAGNRTFQASGSMMSILSWEAVFRALEGARLYHLLDHPTVVVSGGVTSTEKGARPESEAMRDAVVQLGVPPDHVVMESESRNTRDEAFII